MQWVVFLRAPFVVAFGLKLPSQMSIRCRLYHCLMPSSFASLSAMSPAISLPIFSKSPSIVELMLWPRLLKNEPIEVTVAEGLEEVVVVGMSWWPSVEVLSWRGQYCLQIERRMSYGHDVVILHEAWFVTCEQAEHRQHEGRNGTSQREESCYAHIEC